MKFIFDTGLTLTSTLSDFTLEPPITGLGMPPIRTSETNYSGRDGGRVEGGQYFSGRLISIPGNIATADDCADHDQLRIELIEKLPKNQDISVEVVMSNFSVFTTVRVIDLQMDYSSLNHSRFKIDLYAGDPLFYTQDGFTVGIDRAVGGGFLIPFTLPVTFDPGSGVTVVNNTGTVLIYPTFVIDGEATDPRFTNVDTGEFFELSLTASSGDEIRIDSYNRTVTLNGSSILYLVTEGSSWLTLPVGTTRFSYTTSSGSDTGTASVTWRSAIASI